MNKEYNDLLDKLIELSKQHNELVDKLKETHDEYIKFHKEFESAFSKNNDNELDLIGHKEFHKTQSKLAEERRITALLTKRAVIQWAVIGLLVALTTVFSEQIISPIIEIIKREG